MNTKLHLLYRDGDNYKRWMEVVLAGELDAEALALIESKLDQAFCIAHQVGLPTPSFGFRGMDGWPNEEIDHVYTTLIAFEDGAPSPDDLRTDLSPTIAMTAAELLENFKRVAEWDVGKEWRRMLTDTCDEYGAGVIRLDAPTPTTPAAVTALPKP